MEEQKKLELAEALEAVLTAFGCKPGLVEIQDNLIVIEYTEEE